MERHEIWRRVRHDYEQAARRAPANHEPEVVVFLAGAFEPLALGFVETRREPDDPWIRLESEVRGAETDEATALPPACSWTHVHESAVLGVTVRFRRKGREGPTGFVWSDQGPSSE